MVYSYSVYGCKFVNLCFCFRIIQQNKQDGSENYQKNTSKLQNMQSMHQTFENTILNIRDTVSVNLYNYNNNNIFIHTCYNCIEQYIPINTMIQK